MPEDTKSDNPYDHPMHRQHVGIGFCSSIHVSKAWCDKDEGHKGKHRAPGLGRSDTVWDNKGEYPRYTE